MNKSIFIATYCGLFAFGLTAQNTKESSLEDGTNRVLVLKPKGHKGLIQDLSLTPDGKSIISAGQDKTIRIWDVDSYDQRGEILGHIGDENFGTVYAARVSPDGNYLATAGIFGSSTHRQSVADIRIYDFKTQKIVKVFEGHKNENNSLRWSQDSRYLISANGDKTVGIWDVKNMAFKSFLKGHGDKVWCADIFGYKIVSGSKDNMVNLWDLNTGKILATSYDHVGQVMRAAFHPSGQYIVTGGTDSQINIYDADLNFLDAKYLKQGISAICFDQSGSLVVVGFNDGSIKVYQFAAGSMKELTSYQPHQGAFVAGVQVTADKRIFSAGGADSNIAVYQLNGNKADSITNIAGSTQKVRGAGLNDDLLAFSMDTKRINNIAGLRDVDFTFGFNLISRDFDKLDQGNQVYKATIGGVFTEQTFSFHGKKYLYKVPITQLGGFKATKNGSAFYIKYEPDVMNDSELVQSGKFTDFEWGDILFNIDDKATKYCLSFTPDSLLVVGGTGGYLNVFDLKGKLVTKLSGHEDVVFSVNMSTDNRWVISGSQDQSIRLWDAQRLGKESELKATATFFFSKEGEWITITDDGYYMSSVHGGKYVGFHQNQGFRADAKYYPFENFDLKYNRPDLVLAKLEMGEPRLRELLYQAYQKRVKKMGLNEEDIVGELNLPEVHMNTAGITVSDKQYNLNITATDSQMALDRINVYVNDIPIFGTSGISLKNEKDRLTITRKIPVELIAGKNKIQVSVMNIAGVESLKETVNVFYNGATIKPDLHVVAIGVSNYKDSQYNLTYAAKDATDIANAFHGHYQRYNRIYIHKFTDALAQREQILAVKDKLQKTKVEDEVIVFMAGHGLLDSKLDYYFATHDIDFNNPAGRGLKYEELEGLLDGIPARQKLMLIDACHSGEVDKEDTKLIASSVSGSGVSARGFAKKPQPVGIDNVFELMQELFADLRRGTGAMVISSSSGVEFSFESEDWNNGVFTYSILEGLKSNQCDANKSGDIQISELRDYVFKRVEKLTNGKQHPTSRRENLEFDFVVW